MKKIINGKRYDTDKSILVGASSSGGFSTDFRHWSAGLYRTPRSGQYFLAGRGGPMTSFATHHSDGSRSGGEGIIVMSEAEALEWAEAELTTEEVEQGFGDRIEDA